MSSAGAQPVQPPSRPVMRLGFRPRLFPTLLMAVVVPVFLSLGQWQHNKARVKEDAQSLRDTRSNGPAVAISVFPIADSEPLRQRPVTATGAWDAAGQILLDNQVFHERVGYHVLTPLRLEGSDMRVLVNRGWVMAPSDRSRLPEVQPPAGTVTVNGTATIPSSKFFGLAPDTASPGANSRWQALDLARYRREAGVPVQPVVVQLSPDSDAGGYAREWPRLDDRHERHLSYAFQWYGFALASVGIWLFFTLRPNTR